MIGQGRRAQLVGNELVIGRKHRVGIRVVATDGKPQVRTRTTHRDAVSDLLGCLVDLDIRIPERRAALAEIRRALELAPLELHVPTAKREGERISGDVVDGIGDVADCLEVVDTVSSCDVPSCDLPSCDLDLPCDVPCDPGCF